MSTSRWSSALRPIRRTGFSPSSSRGYIATRPARDAPPARDLTWPASEQKAEQETQDISHLNGLLEVVRTRADPAHYRSMPMRSGIFWSDALHQSSHASASSASPVKLSPGASFETAAPIAAPPDPIPVDLTPRRMHESYSEMLLPFASTPALLEEYVNASGGLQTGKLMEHLDSLAGSIAYKHVLGGHPDAWDDIAHKGFYIVTASVDRLDMLAPLAPTRDMRLSGQVIYTGRSSMEVVVKMEALEPGKDDQTLLLGRFSMVCRNSLTHRAREINPLEIVTPEERALYDMGEAHKNRRQSLALRALTRTAPTSAEAETLHAFFLQYGQENGEGSNILQEGEERVWMGDTRLEMCQLMFPQERNIHQKIFGGYLMRLAYELGFTNCSLFTRQPVRFLSLDKISFAKPVPIGSILRLTSRILHSTVTARFPVLVHVGVQANVVDVKTGNEQTTNDFRFTWCREDAEPLARKVVPKTYREAMLWLEAKRALEMNSLLGQQWQHRG